ncbi:fungal hydrophobin [Auriscalpium vulgare]|uniref:Fungal hydrophobin n=1 Tax=Auriscalpium vulgare TaxID=40419 RepID=A0ACB8RVA5_9AGAM|nr:fungal hydrophobin [Auriscalpium vulgare]
MFSRLSTVVFVALAGYAAAMPGGGKPTTTSTPPVTTTVTVTAPPTTSTVPASSCTTGSLQCCDSTAPATSTAVAPLLGLLGIVVQGVDVIVGLTCDPITVIGVGSDGCSAQTVCCDDDDFKGVVAIGCTPVDISL